jgi:uncharacterized protein
MANQRGVTLRGVFYDSPVQGLDYQTQTLTGLTNEKGEFKYREGETVTFSVGGLVLGSAAGRDKVSPADIIIEAGGDIKKLKIDRVTNIARFLQSLDKGGNIEERIVISEAVRRIVKRYLAKIDFNQKADDFSNDPEVKALFTELKTGLRTAEQARNHLRRSLYGIQKLTDVKIPMRDGAYLLGDIFRPIAPGKYPVVMALGVFGKAFGGGIICNEKQQLEREVMEDHYFEGNTDPSPFAGGPSPWENHETANSVDWVPRGYIVLRVDGRGVGKTPGKEEMFSLQEAKDIYDTIEWAAKQPWSNGRVGLWGTGYYGMVSYNTAQLQPPHLKAMIPVSADSNSYRDYIYTGGGLFNMFSGVRKNSCGKWQGVDWVRIAKAHPFDDPEIYGPAGSICLGPDLSKIKVPFWDAMGLSATIHTRGASEAYISSSSKNKKLTILSETGIHFWAYAKEFLEEHIAFFDYWLKGIDNGIMDGPPVKMMVRTGRGGFYWQSENEWPIARTQYTKYYLDASPSDWKGDGKKKSFFKLQKSSVKQEKSAAYPAGVEWKNGSNWQYGASFVTEPMARDTLLAGYMELVTWVSSTTKDMELHAAVRVYDENNLEVPYPLGIFDITTGKDFPVSFGALKVSHRKLDPQKSTVFRPYHTHRKEDYQPLKPNEPVEAEVEIWPMTALVKKGYRIRLDIQPVCGDGLPTRIYDAVDQSYQKGATNTIYTGPDHRSYLQLPVIPPKRTSNAEEKIKGGKKVVKKYDSAADALLKAYKASNGEKYDLVIEHGEIKDLTPQKFMSLLDYVNDAEGYRQWYPDEHVSFEWEVAPKKGNPIGSIHRAVERIGPFSASTLRIRVEDPKSCKISRKYKQYVNSTMLGPEDEEMGSILHEFKPSAKGVRMRSVFRLPARIPQEFLDALTRHCIGEMEHIPVMYLEIEKAKNKKKAK